MFPLAPASAKQLSIEKRPGGRPGLQGFTVTSTWSLRCPQERLLKSLEIWEEITSRADYILATKDYR